MSERHERRLRLATERRARIAAMAAAAPAQPASAAPIELAGPALWNEAHARPLTYAGDAPAERDWIRAFAARLPAYGCACTAHFNAAVATTPPDLSSAEAYARWWWRRHEDVNRRLGKPPFPWPACVTRHGYPPAWAGEAHESPSRPR